VATFFYIFKTEIALKNLSVETYALIAVAIVAVVALFLTVWRR
jgi:hypothetical protein